ncbi:hypothetical protein Mgra_00006844 [Meloidogyne graminicola]|uniref:Uncharacterized protein n=1 Tax=Meloidogyne graminicola TaxID=189291 RepID=A0A8S9ZKR7_9BILA|nr:hypothetical protein Mgra_00006844 [Meloidogyne graminicola]
MKLSIFVILFIIFIIILPNCENTRRKKHAAKHKHVALNTNHMVKYCEEHSQKKIKNRTVRKCCNEIVKDIIKKKKHDKAFKKHMSRNKHLTRVINYFSQIKLPRKCNKIHCSSENNCKFVKNKKQHNHKNNKKKKN